MLKEIYKGIEIPYTCCFCRYLPDQKVLLVKRAKRPNLGKWNGLGGKVEEYDKNSKDSVDREMREEADIDLTKAKDLRFAGFVTWNVSTRDGEKYVGGMYIFIADFDDPNILFEEKETREGTLAWKDIPWLLDKNNKETVDNEPFFLEQMFNNDEPLHCHCTYVGGELVNFEVLPIEK